MSRQDHFGPTPQGPNDLIPVQREISAPQILERNTATPPWWTWSTSLAASDTVWQEAGLVGLAKLPGTIRSIPHFPNNKIAANVTSGGLVVAGLMLITASLYAFMTKNNRTITKWDVAQLAGKEALGVAGWLLGGALAAALGGPLGVWGYFILTGLVSAIFVTLFEGMLCLKNPAFYQNGYLMKWHLFSHLSKIFLMTFISGALFTPATILGHLICKPMERMLAAIFEKILAPLFTFIFTELSFGACHWLVQHHVLKDYVKPTAKKLFGDCGYCFFKKEKPAADSQNTNPPTFNPPLRFQNT